MSAQTLTNEQLETKPPANQTRNGVEQDVWTVKWYMFGGGLGGINVREMWVQVWSGTLEQVEAAALNTARKRCVVASAIWSGLDTDAEPMLVLDKRTPKAQRKRPLPVAGLMK